MLTYGLSESTLNFSTFVRVTWFKLSTVDTSILLKTFLAVFVLADAIGNIPILLVLTKGMEPERRNKVIDKAILVAIAVLLVLPLVADLS